MDALFYAVFIALSINAVFFVVWKLTPKDTRPLSPEDYDRQQW